MKGQITLEYLITITVYILIITMSLQVQKRMKYGLETRKMKSKNYRNISETSDACSYKYLHGPSVKIKEKYSSPTRTENNSVILGEGDKRAISDSLSPRITSSKERITCSSTRPWYLKKVK